MEIFTVLVVRFDEPNGKPFTLEVPKTFSNKIKAMNHVMESFKDVKVVDRTYESHVLYEFTESSLLYYITITVTNLDE